MTEEKLEELLAQFRKNLETDVYAPLTLASKNFDQMTNGLLAAVLLFSAELKNANQSNSPTPSPVPSPPAPAPAPIPAGTMDTKGDIWNISAVGKVTKNGGPATDPDYTANVVELILWEDIPYQRNTAGNWYKWSGQPHWTQTSDPRLTPAPSPTPAAKLPELINGEYVSKDFTVPPHFLGMHLNSFPQAVDYGNASPSPVPIVDFQNVNNWDYSEKSAGVHMISQPRIMDVFMSYWKSKGAFIIDTPALMPKEVAQDNRVVGPYNWPGCTAGLDLSKREQYKAAAKARLIRYKGTIKVINPLNEPDYGKVSENADFFRGSMANGAEIISVWREVIDEVDPSVILLGNSAVFWGYQNATNSGQFNTPFDRYTEALGTRASNGRRVIDMLDAVGIHHYGESHNSIFAIVTCVERARASLKALGVSKDVWITECGFTNGKAPNVSTAATTMRKWVIAAAIAQAKGIYLYSYDGENFQYMSNNTILQDVYADLQNRLNGKKIKEAKIRPDGTALIVFEDGVSSITA